MQSANKNFLAWTPRCTIWGWWSSTGLGVDVRVPRLYVLPRNSPLCLNLVSQTFVYLGEMKKSSHPRFHKFIYPPIVDNVFSAFHCFVRRSIIFERNKTESTRTLRQRVSHDDSTGDVSKLAKVLLEFFYFVHIRINIAKLYRRWYIVTCVVTKQKNRQGMENPANKKNKNKELGPKLIKAHTISGFKRETADEQFPVFWSLIVKTYVWSVLLLLSSKNQSKSQCCSLVPKYLKYKISYHWTNEP